MTREEHYTDGRRWSHISKAWILLSSWNDREELATMTAAAESVRLENVRQRALIEQQAKEIARLTGIVHLLTTGECGASIKTRFPFTFQQAIKEEHP